MASVENNDERSSRRLKERFPIPNLGVRIKQRSIFSIGADWRDATGVDFNRYGVAVLSNTPYKVGNRIYLSFSGPYISLENVAAQVVSRMSCKEGFRFGVVFLYWQHEEHYEVGIDNALARIERIYHDHHYCEASD